MHQRSLFDLSPPLSTAPTTTAAAAEAIRPNVGRLRAFVLDYLRHVGEVGATDEELQEALGMNPSTQRPRRLELQQLGFVEHSGATRKTRSGRAAMVWRLTAEGRAAAEEGGKA